MRDWTATSITAINEYLWNELQEELGWSTVKGLQPITPGGEIPQFEESTNPYIVYTYTTMPSGEAFYIESEMVTYEINSPKEGDIRQAINLIRAIFNRYDSSAYDINKWIQSNGHPLHKRFDFKYTVTAGGEGADAARTEGGRSTGMIMVRTVFMYIPDSAQDDRLSKYSK